MDPIVRPSCVQLPIALILVRNAVRHDARVLREAHELERLGFEVLIAGVVTAGDRERTLVLDGIRVVRCDPGAGLRRVVHQIRWQRTPATAPAGDRAGRDQARDATAPARPSLPMRRLVATFLYYAAAIRLVLRSGPTLVHANDYNTMWVGIAAKRLRGSRWSTTATSCGRIVTVGRNGGRG